jgi:hypothetical protein
MVFALARRVSVPAQKPSRGLDSSVGGLTMSKAIPNECMALLKEASEMFSETGCVPGIDGEEVPAETIVPDAKEYISETIDDPEAIYDPEIWDTSGFALVLSWLAQKWNERLSRAWSWPLVATVTLQSFSWTTFGHASRTASNQQVTVTRRTLKLLTKRP